MDGLRLLGPGTLAAIVDYTAAERLRLVEDARPPELDTADLWGRIFEGPPVQSTARRSLPLHGHLS
jgi:hypothetical protein